MSLTNPYRQKNYMGEYADDASVLVFIQANLWDDAGTGLGNPQDGMLYYNTTTDRLRMYANGSWNEFLGDGVDRYRGRETISDTDTSATVIFPTGFPDTNYTVAVVPVEVAGSPGKANVNCWVTGIAAGSFTINVSMAPGAGDSLEVHWEAIHD